MRYHFSLVLVVLFILLLKPVFAAQSSIAESDGTACMGDERSRKQTEQAALVDAKKRAVEFASMYIKSETEVKNFAVEKDLLAAYARAEVKIVRELEKAWYKDPSSGDCYKVRIKAEVIPDVKAMESLAKDPGFADDPAAPLKVKAWTDKKDYKEGEKIRVFIKGNKPFYARVLYRDAAGQTIQLLPNPYRKDSYFNGGSVYEIPSGNDKFELEVTQPFGPESVTVFASSFPLGEIDLQTRGGVFAVKASQQDIAARTRSVKLTERSTGITGGRPAEFFEDKVVLITGK